MWSGSDLNPQKEKVSWEEVCHPKQGGLGIRPLTEVNTVYGLRLIWKIMSPKQSL